MMMKKSIKDNPLARLSDTELLKRIETLNQKERETTLSVLMHLIELERRRIYLELGYSSLFDYCIRRLGYSRSSAGRRINAARCIRDYPEIHDLLARGEINLCSVSLVAGILRPDNKDALIAGIRNRSTVDVEEMVSRYRPVSGYRDRVRPVYVKRLVQVTELEEGASPGAGDKEITPACGGGGAPDPARYTGIIVKPTPTIGSAKFPNSGGGAAEDAHNTVNCTILERRLKLDFTVSPEFMGKIEKTRSLLSNKYPRGLNFEKLFGILLDEYLDRHSPEGRIKRREIRKSKKKQNSGAHKEQGGKTKDLNSKGNTGKTNREPRPSEKRTRSIPQRVRDEVFARDGGRCTYVGKNGVRCYKKRNLQIDHIIPYARGGNNTVDNLRLLCAKHNRLVAEREYSKEHMKQFYQKE